jgi:hypothetical protein
VTSVAVSFANTLQLNKSPNLSQKTAGFEYGWPAGAAITRQGGEQAAFMVK